MPRIVTSRRKARGASSASRSGDRAVKAASIAVVLACAAFAAWRLFAPGGNAGPDTVETGVKPADMAPVAGRGVTAVAEHAKTPEEDAAPEATAAGRRNAKGGAPARAAAIGLAPSAPADGGRGDGSDPSHPAPAVTPQERKFFDNEIENTIASVSEPGAEFFGFPPGTDLEEDEIIEILRRPVEILEDDDEATVAAKERTADFKARALKAITEEGLTFNQFVRDLVALRNEQAAMREDVYDEMRKILNREGEEAAREYLKTANAELKAQGLKEIVITPFDLEDD